MKRTIALALLIVLAAVLAGSSASAFSFDDIQLWAGSGSNKAALVIDWNDGKEPQSMVWGYRWDGTATGKNMFDAVLALDSRLYASMEYWESYNSYSVNSINYVSDSANHYAEGMASSYWAYYIAETNSSLPTKWDYSGWDISARPLSNGSWDGWSYAADWHSPEPPSTPTSAPSVPEPSGILALGSGALGLIGFVTRRRAKPQHDGIGGLVLRRRID
ncbi:MAG: PEP-CTERM sorting domain-containing protein [Armatimonadota bacterium]